MPRLNRKETTCSDFFELIGIIGLAIFLVILTVWVLTFIMGHYRMQEYIECLDKSITKETRLERESQYRQCQFLIRNF